MWIYKWGCTLIIFTEMTNLNKNNFVANEMTLEEAETSSSLEKKHRLLKSTFYLKTKWLKKKMYISFKGLFPGSSSNRTNHLIVLLKTNFCISYDLTTTFPRFLTSLPSTMKTECYITLCKLIRKNSSLYNDTHRQWPLQLLSS